MTDKRRQRLEEPGRVVVSCDRDDGPHPARAQAGESRQPDVQCLDGRDRPVEQVTTVHDEIHLFGVRDRYDLSDHLAIFVGAVVAPQPLAHMPI